MGQSEPITHRVSRGVSLLDKSLPGWRSKVDVDGLEMRLCTSCLLRQLFGDFNDGLALLGLPDYGARAHRAAVSHGFDLDEPKTRQPGSQWDELDEAWIAVINAEGGV
jgi:hypothetical protein